MNLVACETVQLICVESLAKDLFLDEGTILQFRASCLIPGHHLVPQELEKTLSICSIPIC
jgi:hypothetical protein